MNVLRTPRQAGDWLRGRGVAHLHCDSRKVGTGDGFVAWPGAATDGRKFVPVALKQGAVACLVEAQGREAFAFSGDAVAAYAWPWIQDIHPWMVVGQSNQFPNVDL